MHVQPIWDMVQDAIACRAHFKANISSLQFCHECGIRVRDDTMSDSLHTHVNRFVHSFLRHRRHGLPLRQWRPLANMDIHGSKPCSLVNCICFCIGGWISSADLAKAFHDLLHLLVVGPKLHKGCSIAFSVNTGEPRINDETHSDFWDLGSDVLPSGQKRVSPLLVSDPRYNFPARVSRTRSGAATSTIFYPTNAFRSCILTRGHPIVQSISATR
mmetsp:Transcript_73199/g.210215  ORF Transcript_73199/g.210215 Transcript_73199/m.210215 type:complete len:215 (+) Transcript_73199:373-1017(+)